MSMSHRKIFIFSSKMLLSILLVFAKYVEEDGAVMDKGGIWTRLVDSLKRQ
jgi:hypothetical protein